MTNATLILFSAIFGFTSVGLGAFGAHALKEKLDTYSMGVFQTGVQYQTMHALALLGLGILLSVLPALAQEKAAQIAGYSFVVGILVFSGSLYALAFTGVKVLGAITPIGGVLFLVGWASLAKLAFAMKN